MSSSTAVVTSPMDRAAESHAVSVAETPEISNPQLLKWMFRFLRPVKAMTVVCGCILMTAVATEIFASRQAGDAGGRIDFERFFVFHGTLVILIIRKREPQMNADERR